MHKYLLTALISLGIIALAGCQNTSSPSVFGSNPFSSSFAPYSSSSGMTLAQSVQDALMRSGDPVMSQVHVETNQNVVILSGYVKKIRQSDMAEQIARQVPGVQNVQNRMIVRQ